jgi:hypothetical protein
MTTPPQAEFVGYDRDNDMYWKVSGHEGLILARTAERALHDASCGFGGRTQEEIEERYGLLTKEPK